MPERVSGMSFVRPDESARLFYDLIKSGQYEKAMQQMMGANARGPRPQQMPQIGKVIPNEKLPDFATIAKYLTGAIAVAFLSTFYGIGFANLIFLPVGGKLKVRSEEEVLVKQLQIDGVLSISAGDNPRIVEEKLKAYMPPKIKAQLDAATAAAEGGGK